MKYVIPGAMCRVMVPVWRIAIPKEIRDYFEITINSTMAIFYNEDSIILKKYEPDCIFCGKSEGLFHFNGKNICMACAIDLNVMDKSGLLKTKCRLKTGGSSSAKWKMKLKKEQRYIKKIEQSGIFLIPQMIRETMFINIDEPMAIFVDDDLIILKKHFQSCLFCGTYNVSSQYMDKYVCLSCIEELRNSVEK